MRRPPTIDIDKTSDFTDNNDGTATIDYTIEVTNSGTGPGSYDLTDTISLAPGVIIDEVTGLAYGGEDDGLQGALNDAFDGTADTAVVTGESLAAGESESFTYTVTVSIDPDTLEIIDNPCGTDEIDVGVANVAELSTGGMDEECNDVPGVADLDIEKVDAVDPIVAGPDDDTAQIDYTISVTNNGPLDATGVTVVDTLPSGSTFVSADPSCSESAGVVTCVVGDLAVGASVEISLTIEVPAVDGSTVENAATVSGDQHDPDPSNDTDDETTDIEKPKKDIPRTGSEIGRTLALALLLLGGGVALWASTRRRSRA